MSELDGIEAIAAGWSYSLALKDDGTVWAWGANERGQLGNGTFTLGTSTAGINTPVQVGNLSAVKAIASGGQHSLAGWQYTQLSCWEGTKGCAEEGGEESRANTDKAYVRRGRGVE